MDIYKLLVKDHDKVKKLLSSIEKQKDLKIFEELKKEMFLHNEAEEEVFYEPLEARAGKLKIIVKGGHEEHELVMKMMKQLDKITDDAEWMNLFAVIKKSIEAHINMEEAEMFDLAKKHFSTTEAKEMASEMEEAKNKFAAEYAA